MNGHGVAAFSIPLVSDLLGAVLGPLVDLGASIAGSVLGEVIEGLTSAVIGALVDMVASILEFFWEASEPNLQAPWFSGSDTPYQQLILLAAPLLVCFAFAGIIQGSLKGDTGGMLRMMLLRLPGAVLGMSITVAVTDILLKVTDEMSRVMLASFQKDVTKIGTVLATMGNLAGPSLGTLLLLLLFGFIGLLGAVVVVIQLFIRGALIYLVAALSPLVFAASVWESMKGGVRKLAEVGFALIISKLVIAVALAVAAKALAGSWDGAEVTELTTPEFAAGQAEIPVTQRVGIILTGSVMFIVAAFMPWVTWRLLPLAEGALVSSGVAGSPLRAWQSGTATANSLAYNPAVSALRSVKAAKKARTRTPTSGDDQQSGSSSPASGGASDKKTSRKSSASTKPGQQRSTSRGGQKSRQRGKPGAKGDAKPSTRPKPTRQGRPQGATGRRPAKPGQQTSGRGQSRPQPRWRTIVAGRQGQQPAGRQAGRTGSTGSTGRQDRSTQGRSPQSKSQRPQSQQRNPQRRGDKR